MKMLPVFTALSLILVACSNTSSLGSPNCDQGVCVKVTIEEPMRLNTTINAKITITAEQEIPKAGVYLSSNDPSGVLFEGTNDWFVDVKANQLTSVTGRIKFTREGYIGVIGAVTTPKLHIQDIITVYITQLGGTIYLPGTPLPITPFLIKTPPPVILNSQGTPIPSPTRAAFSPTPFIPTPTRRPYP